MSKAATQEKPQNTGLPAPEGEQNIKNQPLPKTGEKPLVNRGERKYRGTLGPANTAEQQCNHFVIDAQDGDTVADVTNPKYWANVASGLRPKDKIEVWFNDEENKVVHLLVTGNGHLWATVKIDRVVDFADSAQEALGMHMEEAINDYNVFCKGGTSKWVVERKSDKQILQRGLPDRNAANAWVDDYKKALQR